jgi:hypothetical protein
MGTGTGVGIVKWADDDGFFENWVFEQQNLCTDLGEEDRLALYAYCKLVYKEPLRQGRRKIVAIALFSLLLAAGSTMLLHNRNDLNWISSSRFHSHCRRKGLSRPVVLDATARRQTSWTSQGSLLRRSPALPVIFSATISPRLLHPLHPRIRAPIRHLPLHAHKAEVLPSSLDVENQ